MKARLSAIAVATLVAGMTAPAFAETPVFYGDFNMSLTNADKGLVTNPGMNDGFGLENNFTNIGVKGTHDIGAGLNVVYKAEVGVNGEDQSNGSNPFNSRNTYFGLGGNFGEVVFGRNDTVFKSSEGSVDAFGNLNADLDRLFVGQDRLGDSITFKSASIAGFNINATYVLEDDFYGGSDAAELNDGNNYAIAASFGDRGMGKTPYYVAVSYADGLNGLEALRVVGTYKLGDLKLGAMFQDSEKGDLDGTGYLVSAQYRIGDWNIKGQFGYDDSGLGKFAQAAYDDQMGEGAEVTNYSIGAEYTLTKAAYIYGHYTYLDASHDVEGDVDDNMVTVGLRYRF
ncbi:porin [Ferrimonas marina]|uniref:Outer membrane protein (Porin) n=1 Tax=Ferrimonas marina TaxID=299255 RepID=A0A1M5ZLE1_9GAMM|nr:porin [Ferrimonas marina]SHI25004.1 Outer membrane protein (porin) [Ferrimonas marina]